MACLPFSRKLDSLASSLGEAASKVENDNLVSAVEKALSGRHRLTEHVESLKERSYKNVEIIELLDGIK